MQHVGIIALIELRSSTIADGTVNSVIGDENATFLPVTCRVPTVQLDVLSAWAELTILHHHHLSQMVLRRHPQFRHRRTAS
jgi:hypothetical protein